ncbi:MAG: NAD-dependent succinate-semialdehyde dehydrogenase [Candidatus Rickettsia vulgarisii]
MEMLESINKKNYIDGFWVECQDQIPVNSPSTNQQIGSVPNLSDDLIAKAIDSTVKAFKNWSQVPIQQRSTILKKWHSLILENIDELTNILTLEQGKTLDESKKEILYGAGFVEWFAGSIHEIKGKIRNGKEINHKIITEWEPVGPIAAITPWNFPNAMITRKVAPALAAGCSVILKPSEFTPFSALALVKLASDAGLPTGVFNIITGNASNIGQIFCNDFRIRKLSFTGSTRVGKLLYQNSGVTMKRLSMELGGNAPYIIFKDVDLDKVASDLISIKIRSGGQSCTSPNRIFIETAIYDDFVQIILDKFSKLKVGDGFAPDSNIGPLINKAAVDKIVKLLEDAKSKGAKVLCGGKSHNNFFEPTVIRDCQDNMKIFTTEIFGPVLACYKFDNIEEVIARANNTEYGLQSYVYSKDISIAQTVATRLDFGMVSVNDSMPSANITGAFSGRKNSGFGIESSDEAIYEYLNSKYLNIKF